MYIETTEKLLDFIEKSPTAFQAVDEMQKRLTENGFEVLSEKEYWKLVPGGKYLVTRNNSALIAFCIPEKESRVFHIMASHSDSPSFKIKENPEIKVDNSYVKLNVEKYGGMLMAPWFDRPLSVAGRVNIRRNGGLKEKLLAAIRGGLKTALIPEENVKDLQEIPDNVKQGLKIMPPATGWLRWALRRKRNTSRKASTF